MRRKVFARLSTITHDTEMHALKKKMKLNRMATENPNDGEDDDNNDKKQNEEK